MSAGSLLCSQGSDPVQAGALGGCFGIEEHQSGSPNPLKRPQTTGPGSPWSRPLLLSPFTKKYEISGRSKLQGIVDRFLPRLGGFVSCRRHHPTPVPPPSPLFVLTATNPACPRSRSLCPGALITCRSPSLDLPWQPRPTAFTTAARSTSCCPLASAKKSPGWWMPLPPIQAVLSWQFA